ncbi:SDR family oxidoreductase [Congregibacter sp.]|uniref:SDR family oxidoreductase n=1 Tax=Congregibacter sp. TaxID=2744308 RepID=UPI00385C7E28
MELNHCTAIVTGANRGIGAAFVTALLEAGASKVYAACRNPGAADLEFDSSDPRIEPVALDVSQPQSISELAAACDDVQLLVNNAGLFAGETLLGAADVAAARKEMEVNYFGPLQMSRAFAPALARNGGGAIVNVLSAAAIVAVPNMGGYSPSKFAARAMGISLRAELADQKTQVQNLIVGSIDTRMAAHVQGKKESPATVAKAGLRAVKRNIPEVDTDEFAVSVRAAHARDPAKLEQQMAAALKLETLNTGR